MHKNNIIKSKKTFSKNFITLISGTIGTYIFPILFSPFLTRIYSPDDFTLFAIYMTIVQIVSIVATLKYELGIPLVQDREERLDLFRLSIFNSILISFLSFIIIHFYMFLSDNISENINMLKYYIPIGIFLTSLFHHAFYNWLLYRKFFKYISISKIVYGFVYAILPILVFKILNIKDFKYLIISHQIGVSLGLLCILFSFSKNKFLSNLYLFFSFRLNDILITAKKYKKYLLFSSPSNFINLASIWSPIIFIWYFFEPVYASLFFLAHRAINLPFMLLGHSIGKIFYSEASQNISQGTFADSVLKYFKLLLHIAIPFLFIAIFLSPALFDVIYSSNWSESGVITQILAPWLFFTFLASPLSTIPTILYKQEIEFKFQLLLLFMRIISLILGILISDNLYTSLILFSSISAFLWMLYLSYIFKISDISPNKVISVCLSDINEYLMIGIVALLISQLLSNPISIMICSIPLFCYILFSLIISIKKI